MTRLTYSFWFWALVQTWVVLVVAGWVFYVGVSEYLAHPTDGDLYAHTWSFQGVVFLTFTLPKIVVGLLALLALEWFVTRALSKQTLTNEETVA